MWTLAGICLGTLLGWIARSAVIEDTTKAKWRALDELTAKLHTIAAKREAREQREANDG